jgi:hypothetical protein
MNRPEKLNAVSWELADKLAALFYSLRDNDDVRAIVLTSFSFTRRSLEPWWHRPWMPKREPWRLWKSASRCFAGIELILRRRPGYC